VDISARYVKPVIHSCPPSVGRHKKAQWFPAQRRIQREPQVARVSVDMNPRFESIVHIVVARVTRYAPGRKLKPPRLNFGPSFKDASKLVFTFLLSTLRHRSPL
jgi:hypothetical protein